MISGRGSFSPIEKQINKILKSSFVKKKGNFIIINNLIKNWQQIIGKQCFELCAPKKVKFDKGRKNNGVLTITAKSSAAAFYIEINSSQIIENIASYYGYKIISKINIIQHLQDIKNLNIPTSKTIVKITQDQQNLIDKKTESIKNNQLKLILQQLGTSIFTK